MEEHQFRRLLELFPVVRSSTYCAEEDVTRTSNSNNGTTHGTKKLGKTSSADPSSEVVQSGLLDTDVGHSSGEGELIPTQHQKASPSGSQGHGDFWSTLKTVMQARLGDQEGQRFCEVFKTVHDSLIMRTLSLDDIERMAKHLPFSETKCW